MSYETERDELFEKYSKLKREVIMTPPKRNGLDGESSIELRRIASELQHKHYELRKKYGLTVE